MPDKAATALGIQAPVDDCVNRTPLVLTEDRLPCLSILYIEQDPLLECAQKICALEECLHCKAVRVLGRLFPTSHIASVRAPGNSVPIVEQVGDVKQLRRGKQLRGFQFVTPKLGDCLFYSVLQTRVLVLDNTDGDTID